METVKEMRFWINRMNNLNESLKDQTNNQTVEIKEFKQDESNWNYIKDNIEALWEFLNKGYQKAGYEKFCGCDSPKSLLRNANLIKIGFINNQWVAISVYTGYRGGFKNVGITATVEEELRSLGVNVVHDIIKTDIGNFKDFYWTECSGVVENLYEKYNGIKIPNNYVSTILLKPVTIDEDGFHYERDIKGEKQRKIMYGFNDLDTFNKVLSEREEYINNCINNILKHRIDESEEHTSFGKLSQLDCAIAIINFFVDERWENECYELPLNCIDNLKLQINIVKDCIDNHSVSDDKMAKAKLALENGIHIINTSCIMNVYTL